MYRSHQPKADADRMYQPHSEAGRGLIQMENYDTITTVGLNKYLQAKSETAPRNKVTREKDNVAFYAYEGGITQNRNKLY